MQSNRLLRPLFATAAVLPIAGALFAGPVGAQVPDARWQPWLGCWVATTAPTPDARTGSVTDGLVCVVPAPRGAGVDVATIENGVVVHLERVNATGARTPRTMDRCPGWESATWSTDSRRLLLRSEFQCAPSTTVKGSGIFAISAGGDFLQVQGSVVGARASARVVRYRAAGRTLQLDPGGEIKDSAVVRFSETPETFSIRSVRAEAGGDVQPEDVLEVATQVDAAVAEAWLHELGQAFALDGRQLVRLADAGMPPRMIDLMVAMAYPQRFAVRRASAEGSGAVVRGATYGGAEAYGRTGRYGSTWDCGYGDRMRAYGYYGDSCYPGYYGLSTYGYGYGYGSGYGYGYGYWPGYGYGRYTTGYYTGPQLIIVEPRASEDSRSSSGVAVKGQGYTRRDGGSSPSPSSAGYSGSASGSTSGSSSGSSSSAGSTSSTSSGGEARTAQPRKPRD